MPTDFADELEKARAVYEERVRHVAWAAYRETVVPLCRKHRLRFTSGMGVYGFRALSEAGIFAADQDLSSDRVERLDYQVQSFVEEGEAPVGYRDEMRALIADLRAAYAVLDLSVENGHPLGWHVRDYNPR